MSYDNDINELSVIVLYLVKLSHDAPFPLLHTFWKANVSFDF